MLTVRLLIKAARSGIQAQRRRRRPDHVSTPDSLGKSLRLTSVRQSVHPSLDTFTITSSSRDRALLLRWVLEVGRWMFAFLGPTPALPRL